MGFNQPQYTGQFFHTKPDDYNLELAKIINPAATKGWGAVMTPDELRRIWMMGNSKLTTMSGDQYSDEMLSGIINIITQAVAEELQHDILPTQWRHRPQGGDQTREIEPYAKWHDPIDFKNNDGPNNFYVRLRRPLIKIQKWELVDPYSKKLMLDLYPKSIISYETGEIRNVTYGMRNAFVSNTEAYRGFRRFFVNRPRVAIPGAYLVDYISGYDHANRVPKDLLMLAHKVIAIHILSRYGDGIVGGLANFSVGLGVINESVGTTMSASIDGMDKVTVRDKNKRVYDIAIGQFFDTFSGRYTDFEVLAVNPKDVSIVEFKPILDCFEHDSTGKVCYLISCDRYGNEIGITEDHSLFRIEQNTLKEATGKEIQTRDHIACYDFGTNLVTSREVKKKYNYAPRNNKVYDLSVQDYQNFIVNRIYVAHNTSAYFGASIQQLQGELKELLPKIEQKYSGLKMAIL